MNDEFVQSDPGPRNVRPTKSSRNSRIWLIIAIIAVLLFSSVMGFRKVGELDQLRTHGKQYSALVTDKSRTSGKSTSYHISYSFEVGKQDFVDRADVPWAVYSDYRIGGAAVVTAMSDDPSLHAFGAVDAQRVDALTRAWIAGPSFVIGLMLIFLIALEVTIRSQSAILSRATIVRAEVQRIADRVGSKAPTRWVDAAYIDLNGEPQVLSQKLDAYPVERKLTVGKPTTLLIDPLKPGKVLFEICINAVERA